MLWTKPGSGWVQGYPTAKDVSSSKCNKSISGRPCFIPSSPSVSPSHSDTAAPHLFLQVDSEFLEQARLEGMRDGSTAVVVMRLGSVLFAAHAGRQVTTSQRNSNLLNRYHTGMPGAGAVLCCVSELSKSMAALPEFSLLSRLLTHASVC